MISGNNHIKNGLQAQPSRLKTESKKIIAQPKSEPSGPVDSVVTLKTPRPGSAMAQMVEDLQNNGALPKPKPEEAPATLLKTARQGSDMAQMVADINRSELGSSPSVSLGANGTLAILEDPFQFSANSQDGHDSHNSNQGDALLQGHLGTEMVEQVAHKASHGAHHVADAVGHKSTQLTTHVADTAAQKTQTVTQHVTDVASQKTGHLTEALSHKAGQVTNHVATAGHHGAVEHLDAASETLAHATEGAGKLSTGLQVALGASSLLSFGLAIPLAKNAIKEIKHGWNQLKSGAKEKGLRKAVKDGDGVLPLAEGVGGGAVAARSLAASSVMADMTSVGQAIPGLSGVASVASKVLMPLGLIHAGVDIAVGAHEFSKGKKTEGLLKMGFGLAVGGAAVTGALPFTVAAVTLLGGKIAHGVVKSKNAKKAALTADHPKPPTS